MNISARTIQQQQSPCVKINWNAHSLNFFLNSKAINYCILSENFLLVNKVSELKIDNLKSVVNYQSDGCGGVVIFIKKKH